MAALSSLKTDGPSRTYYQCKRGERRIHTQAVLALARLVDVLWALLRDNGTEHPPHHQPSTRLDTIMRFVLAALRALHPDPGSGSAISGCRGERRRNGTPEQGSPRSRRGG